MTQTTATNGFRMPSLSALMSVCLLATLAGCGEIEVSSNSAHSNGAANPTVAIASPDETKPVAPEVSKEWTADPEVVPVSTPAATDDTAVVASAAATVPEKVANPVVPADATAATPAKPVPGKVEVLIKDRTFKTEAGALRVSYDDIDLLKVLNMEPVTPDAVEKMPTWLRQLNGKRVRIRGFMFPPFQETGIARFVLARDNQICCFGRNPKIYDLIAVTMKSGTTTDYIQNRPFDVAGTFRIEMGILEGDTEIFGLYYLDDAAVIVK